MNVEAPPPPGTRLREERERRGLTRQKAADEMRLDAWVVEALESDQYERVGPAVYVKGHLKKYASILAIPGEEIIAGYEALRGNSVNAPPQPPPGRTISSQPMVNNLPWGQIVAVGFLLLLVAGVTLWKPWHQRAGATAVPPAGQTIAQVPGGDPGNQNQVAAQAQNGTEPGGAPTSGADQSAVAMGEATASGSAPAATRAPGAGSTAADAAASAAAAPAGASVPGSSAGSPTSGAPGIAGSGRARLRLSFSAESWVDIHDAAGKRVFSGYGRANSVKSIAGDAPLRVYLGYASGVQLEINERTVAIGRPFVRGDVARFQAGADGVLRAYGNGARARD